MKKNEIMRKWQESSRIIIIYIENENETKMRTFLS